MSLFQSIGEIFQSVQEKLEEWDEWIHEKTGDKLSLGMVAAGMLLLIVILLAAVFLLKPSGVTFQVLDENGNPIDGALVRLYDEDGDLVATARSVNGTVHFDGIPDKKYSFTVTKDGYEDARGEYDPTKPGSAIIRLKPATPGGTGGGSYSPPGSNPPALIEPPVLLPGSGGGGTGGGGSGEPTPPPQVYIADAELTVVVRDTQSGQALANAIVTLRDAATNAFVVQGPTTAQGSVKAGLRQGSSILVSVFASGYASPLPKTVTIGGPQTTVEMLMSSAASGLALETNVTVLDATRSAVAGARVQVYAASTVADQITAANGSLSILLEKDRTYNVRASKAGFQDVTAALLAGASAELILNASDASIPPASLIVAVADSDGLPSATAQVGIYKLIAADWVPFVALTANAQGVAQVDGLQAGWSIRANATSVRGTPSASNETILAAGNNTLTLRLPAEDFHTQVSPTPTPTPIPTPTTCPDGTVCPSGQVCIQGTGGSYACQATPTPTPSPSASVTPTPTPGTSTDYTACLKPANGATSLELNGFTYALKDLNGVQQATFEVTRGNSLTCAAYTPRCTYVLGVSNAANDELAVITNGKLIVTSIDPQTSCADVSVTTACTGGSCTQTTQCPATYDPVCGSNGVTYANSCQAKKSGVAYISGTCGVQCTDQYDPVCADGVEYPNSCIANQNKVQYVSGKCPLPSDGTALDVPAGWSLVAPLSRGALLATDCTAVYHYIFRGYDPSTGAYLPVRPSEGTSAVMEYATGYAVFSDHACKLYWQSGDVPTYYRKTIPRGWSLIGAPSTPKTFRQILGDCSNVAFYANWGDNEADVQRTPLSLDQQMQPGRGYWVGGDACTLTDEPPEPDRLLYRCYRSVSGEGDHFLSLDPACEVSSCSNCQNEGSFAKVYSSQLGDTQPVYRCYHSSTSQHYTSLDAACEAQNAPGAVMESILGYTRKSAANGFSTFYRCWNRRIDHLPTFSDTCEGAAGFINEGSMGFAKPDNSVTGGTTGPRPPAVVCRRTAVGSCAPTGNLGTQTCGTSCPAGFSASGGSCQSSGTTGEYGLQSCTGSAECRSDESYPALGQCNAGDVSVESGPSDTSYFYTCKRKIVGTCAASGSFGSSTCGTTCPSGYSGATGSCTATGSVGDYGLASCSGSADCLSDVSYTTLSGCQSGDVQISRVSASQYVVCRRAAVGSCGLSGQYYFASLTCANTCPSGYFASPSSCSATGQIGQYGATACTGTAQCLSFDSYVASSNCNAGDVKINTVNPQVYAICKRMAQGSCNTVTIAQGGIISYCGTVCPDGYTSTDNSCKQTSSWLTGLGCRYEGDAVYSPINGANIATLTCISTATYTQAGGCNTGDVQVGTVTGT